MLLTRAVGMGNICKGRDHRIHRNPRSRSTEPKTREGAWRRNHERLGSSHVLRLSIQEQNGLGFGEWGMGQDRSCLEGQIVSQMKGQGVRVSRRRAFVSVGRIRPEGPKGRGDALRARSDARGGPAFQVGERRLTRPTGSWYAPQAQECA